jgi:lysophospholipase L1-like esterase
MKLLAVGDSFTYGEELADLNNAWPYLLGKKIGYDVVNMAKPGAGCMRALRYVVEQVYTDRPDLVLIAWPSPGRVEFADNEGFFDIWPGYQGRMFDGISPWRYKLIDYVTEYHNDQYLHNQFVLNCILIQKFLESQNVKYAMTHVNRYDYYHVNGYQNYSLVDQINKNTFVDGYNYGMIEWTNHIKRAPGGHLLEQGHEVVAEKFYEHIRNLGWVS